MKDFTKEEIEEIEEIEEAERLSQELGSGLFVPGVSRSIPKTPRILDVDIINLIKSGDLADAENAVYLYRNQWLDKLDKARLDLETEREMSSNYARNAGQLLIDKVGLISEITRLRGALERIDTIARQYVSNDCAREIRRITGEALKEKP